MLFYFSGAIINIIIFLISFLDYSYEYNRFFFCFDYSILLLNLLSRSNNALMSVYSPGFSTYKIISSVKRGHFTSFFLVEYLLFIFFLA